MNASTFRPRWSRGAVVVALAASLGCGSSRRPDDADGGTSGDAGVNEDDAGLNEDDAGASGEFSGDAVRFDTSWGGYEPLVAIDSGRNATVVWSEGSLFSRRWEDGQWLDPEDLGIGSADSLAFNAAGEGVLTSHDVDEGKTRARFWAPRLGWMASEVIGSGFSWSEGAVTIGGSGRAIALFGSSSDNNGPIHFAVHDPGDGWQQEAPVEPEGMTRMADIAANENDEFAGVWTRSTKSDETAWASRHADGWMPSVQVGTQQADVPRVAVDGGGTVFVAWPYYAVDSLMAGVQPPGCEYGVPKFVGSFGGSQASFAIAASPDQGACLAWAQMNARGIVDAKVACYDPNDGWDEPVTVDVLDSDDLGGIAIAMDDQGGVLVVWSQSDGVRKRIWARRHAAGGRWRNLERVDQSDDAEAINPRIDMAPDGTTVIAWENAAGAAKQIWARILLP